MPVCASLPQDLRGCCTFTLFPGLCLLSLFLGQSTVITCAVVPVLQNLQEQDGPERVQGASKTRDLPAGFVRVSGASLSSGADLFPSLFCAFPRCSFMVCSATEELSACDLRTRFLQTCALVSCKCKLPAADTAGTGVVFFGVGF